jgi:hypothetical protein
LRHFAAVSDDPHAGVAVILCNYEAALGTPQPAAEEGRWVVVEAAYPDAEVVCLRDEGRDELLGEEGPGGRDEREALARVTGQAWMAWCESYEPIDGPLDILVTEDALVRAAEEAGSDACADYLAQSRESGVLVALVRRTGHEPELVLVGQEAPGEGTEVGPRTAQILEEWS